jgi:hypothetical protein
MTELRSYYIDSQDHMLQTRPGAAQASLVLTHPGGAQAAVVFSPGEALAPVTQIRQDACSTSKTSSIQYSVDTSWFSSGSWGIVISGPARDFGM